MHRPSPLLTLVVAVLACALLAGSSAGAQEPPEPLPPGFTDGQPVGAEPPPAAEGGTSLAPAASASPAAVTKRYFGEGAYQAVRTAVAATTRSCAISNDGLTALVLAPVFKESSAATTAASAPAPMTLSRYDEWNGTMSTADNRSANYGLYAFRQPTTPYPRAYWHPGIGIWQYDSAGLGAPYTAVERMDVEHIAGRVATTMSARYCNAGGSDQNRRYEAWRDWGFPCTLCQGFFVEMTGTSPKFANLVRVPGVSKLGGTVERTCTLKGRPGTLRCWYVNPSVGVIQGATAWATLSPGGGSPTVAPAPLSYPFYVLDRGTTEERHWLREDTGYGIDISASRTIGKNARPRSNQAGSGLAWAASSGLCDLSTGHGDCLSIDPPAPPGGVTSAALSIGGSYRPASLDVNGDGQDDVLWYAPGAAGDSVWVATGSATFSSRPLAVTGTYDDVLTGDVDGDGREDVVWYARGSGAAYLWRSVGDGTFHSTTLTVGAGRRPLLLDVDGDGDQELLWYGPGAVPDALWTWNGSRFTPQALAVGGSYRPLVGDFDGNGRDDVFWYAAGTASDHLWLYRPTGGYLSVARPVNGSYQPAVGDFDGDGVDDLLWYAPGAAGDSTWFGGPGGTFANRSIAVQGTFRPLVADLEGDGADDVVWLAAGPAGDYWWRWSPQRQAQSTPLSIPGPHEALVGAFSAGGEDGILWYHAGPTPDALWYR